MDCLSPLGKTSLVQVGIGNIHVVSVQNRSFIVDVNCPSYLCSAMAMYGTLPKLSGKDWLSYVDRMGFYFEVNDIILIPPNSLLFCCRSLAMKHVCCYAA